MLRDPVHGDVYLSDEEIAVIDTAEFQRLRGVRQLGAAYLVYPGALHTRFEHSIGTLHMAQRMLDAVQLNHELDPRGCLGVGAQEARVVRLAALVHDITHIPFGHGIEDQTGLLERHDTPGRFRAMLGPKTEVGRLLGELGVREEVLAVLLPPGQPDLPAVPPYWAQILSDTICADLFDYLARDAYYTGLRIQVDPRLANYFKVDRQSGNLFIDLAKRELLREDILSEIVRMLEARYYFSERVYYHHAKVAAGAMVARAVELALESGWIADRDLYGQTDASLLDLLRSRAGHAGTGRGEDGARAARVRRLAERVALRRLHKRAAVYPRPQNSAVQEELVSRFFARERAPARAEAEARLADLVRFSSGESVDVIVYCPAARMQLKEAQTHVRWPGDDRPRPLSEQSERVPRLGDLERSYRDLWKFYVLVDSERDSVLAATRRAAAEEFGEAISAYRPGA